MTKFILKMPLKMDFYLQYSFLWKICACPRPALEHPAPVSALRSHGERAPPSGFRRRRTSHRRFFSPQSHIWSRIGIRDLPRGVRLYSTLGGIWGYSSRWISRSASSSFKVELRVL